MIYQDDMKCCPFCGRKPECKVKSIEDDFVRVEITCEGCGVTKSGHGSVAHWHTPAAYISAIQDALYMAVENWNRRA